MFSLYFFVLRHISVYCQAHLEVWICAYYSYSHVVGLPMKLSCTLNRWIRTKVSLFIVIPLPDRDDNYLFTFQRWERFPVLVITGGVVTDYSKHDNIYVIHKVDLSLYDVILYTYVINNKRNDRKEALSRMRVFHGWVFLGKT